VRDGGTDADRLIRGVVTERAVTNDQWRDIIRMLRELRAPDMAYAKATEYATRAKASLDVFPPSRERDALKALADYVLSRDR
jgi:geranylgeranyl pyrophosphate synthase